MCFHVSFNPLVAAVGFLLLYQMPQCVSLEKRLFGFTVSEVLVVVQTSGEMGTECDRRVWYSKTVQLWAGVQERGMKVRPWDHRAGHLQGPQAFHQALLLTLL